MGFIFLNFETGVDSREIRGWTGIPPPVKLKTAQNGSKIQNSSRCGNLQKEDHIMRSKSIRLPLAAAALSLAMLTSCGAPGGAGSSVSSASSSGSGAQSAPAAVQVEPLTVQDFPCSTTEEFTALFQKMVQETPDQIYYHPYTGLFQEAVEADFRLSGPEALHLYSGGDGGTAPPACSWPCPPGEGGGVPGEQRLDRGGRPV